MLVFKIQYRLLFSKTKAGPALRRSRVLAAAPGSRNAGIEIVDKGLNSGPEAEDAEQDSGDDENDVGNKLEDEAGAGEPVAVVHPEPEDARKTVREPRDEESSKQAEQAVEDGNGLGNDHGDRPHTEDHSNPGDGRDLSPANHVLAIAEDSAKDVLAGNVAVNDASNDNGGDGDNPNGDEHATLGREQGGGGNVGADVDVDNDCGDEVERSVDELEESESLGPVVGVLELANDAEEARVARWKENELAQERRA